MNVYKYRSGDSQTYERDLSALVNEYFWASTRFDLNDPCEGLVTKETLDYQLDVIVKLFNMGEESFKKVKAAFDEVVKFSETSGIYSLSATPNDELLWAHYGNSHKGFCIEYCIDTLIDFTKLENHKISVKYSDKPPKLHISDVSKANLERILQKLLGTKSKKWSYEKEIRIITSRSGKQYFDFRAVKGIYFGLRMPEKLQNRLMEELAGRGIKYYKMNMKNDYNFYPVPVEDRYLDSPKYKYSIAPITKWAISPEYVNEKYRQYIQYLYMAAEIVRREPYCNEVEMVAFSVDKGTPNKPVIFVQYKRGENRYTNHYLTLPEINAKYAQITDLEKLPA
jgi:hypothetical protein